MGKPTTRVLAVLELLQTNGRMSGTELARRLEVDVRTVRRYLAMLEELGIPVTAERGRDGGYRLMHGFKLPPMMFTNDEALALSLGLLASRNLGLSEAAPAGAGALAKLERVMPELLRKRVGAVSEVVTIDMARASSGGNPQTLAALSACAQAQQTVHLHYRSARLADSERDVDPYALAFWEGHWYLVGYCHWRRERRSFRLDRIVAVHARPASFARPRDFDALAYLNAAVATLPRTHSVKVLLRTDLARARQQVFTSLGILEAVEGGVRLHSQADDLAWMARELARLPFGFTIERPARLRTALQKHARALLAV
jgi:predicted DNA-binding transcriptional regulator YafY